MIELYDSALSGNCHKVRMLLGYLGLQYQKIPVNWLTGEHRGTAYLRVNPRGQLPTLRDGDVVVWDSQAILTYLARRYGSEQWLPLDALSLTRVMQWLMLANEEIRALAWARVAVRLNRDLDRLAVLQAEGQRGLATMERRLERAEWLAADHMTIADIACFPYTALAPEGGVVLDGYPAVLSWVNRITSTPGFVAMPGIP